MADVEVSDADRDRAAVGRAPLGAGQGRWHAAHIGQWAVAWDVAERWAQGTDGRR